MTRCWLVSEPVLDAGAKSFRTLCAAVEVSGIFQSCSDTYLIVRADRALPFGTRIHFRWEGEAHPGMIEDAISDGDQFLIWIQVLDSLALTPHKSASA